MPQVEVKSRATLRAWHSYDNATANLIWPVVDKKLRRHDLRQGDAVEKLLCWGRVDTVTCHVEGAPSAYRISHRSRKSAWSAVTPAGEALINTAKANGMWDFQDTADRLDVPSDLAAALSVAHMRPDVLPMSSGVANPNDW